MQPHLSYIVKELINAVRPCINQINNISKKEEVKVHFDAE